MVIHLFISLEVQEGLLCVCLVSNCHSVNMYELRSEYRTLGISSD